MREDFAVPEIVVVSQSKLISASLSQTLPSNEGYKASGMRHDTQHETTTQQVAIWPHIECRKYADGVPMVAKGIQNHL